jgi:predicted regulator of amino acid metabolism with ACT domain
MVMETDQPVSNEIIEELSNIEGVHEVLLIDCSDI